MRCAFCLFVLNGCYYGYQITFLLKVKKPGILDLLEGSITEYFEQRFVINSNDQVTAAQYKESGLIKGISDCKGLPPLPLGHSVIQQHE